MDSKLAPKISKSEKNAGSEVFKKMHSKSEMEFRSHNNIDDYEDKKGEISSSYPRNPSLVVEGGRWLVPLHFFRQDNRIGF